MSLPDAALVTAALATAAMAGIAWFVQVVHYPLFAAVPEDARAAYAAAHARLTTRVVAPLMIVEALSALVLAARPPAGVASPLPALAAALVAAIWALTWMSLVPAHRAIATGADGAAVHRLVRRNRPRAWLWLARAGVVAAMVATWDPGTGA